MAIKYISGFRLDLIWLWSYHISLLKDFVNEGSHLIYHSMHPAGSQAADEFSSQVKPAFSSAYHRWGMDGAGGKRKDKNITGWFYWLLPVECWMVIVCGLKMIPSSVPNLVFNPELSVLIQLIVW